VQTLEGLQQKYRDLNQQKLGNTAAPSATEQPRRRVRFDAQGNEIK
jgi:hypothetical protein